MYPDRIETPHEADCFRAFGSTHVVTPFAPEPVLVATGGERHVSLSALPASGTRRRRADKTTSEISQNED